MSDLRDLLCEECERMTPLRSVSFSGRMVCEVCSILEEIERLTNRLMKLRRDGQ